MFGGLKRTLILGAALGHQTFLLEPASLGRLSHMSPALGSNPSFYGLARVHPKRKNPVARL